MPPEATAALTLGIMQTKDHTVQGKLSSYQGYASTPLFRIRANKWIPGSRDETPTTGDIPVSSLLCPARGSSKYFELSA